MDTWFLFLNKQRCDRFTAKKLNYFTVKRAVFNAIWTTHLALKYLFKGIFNSSFFFFLFSVTTPSVVGARRTPVTVSSIPANMSSPPQFRVSINGKQMHTVYNWKSPVSSISISLPILIVFCACFGAISPNYLYSVVYSIYTRNCTLATHPFASRAHRDKRKSYLFIMRRARDESAYRFDFNNS